VVRSSAASDVYKRQGLGGKIRKDKKGFLLLQGF
jgi:hypothetical protein